MTQDEEGRAPATIAVTQADRRAAAPYMGFAYQRAIDGECDESTLVEAFARHRTEAQAKLREVLERIAETNRGSPIERNRTMKAIARAALRDTQP